jgi:hypothetical protein
MKSNGKCQLTCFGILLVSVLAVLVARSIEIEPPTEL